MAAETGVHHSCAHGDEDEEERRQDLEEQAPPLRPLKRGAAVMLLVRQLGQVQAADEMAVLRELARMCSGFPLELRCAAHLAARSDKPITDLAVQLATEGSRLVAQGVPRAEERASAVIEATSQQLEAATARAFRLLSLCPGPEVSTDLAAAVLDTYHVNLAVAAITIATYQRHLVPDRTGAR